LNEEASLSIDEIAQRLSGTLAKFKIPRHLIITDEFPLTHSGKVEKSVLRSWIATTPEALGQRRGGG
jgi:fatty-acyl-CoA synthase